MFGDVMLNTAVRFIKRTIIDKLYYAKLERSPWLRGISSLLLSLDQKQTTVIKAYELEF